MKSLKRNILMTTIIFLILLFSFVLHYLMTYYPKSFDITPYLENSDSVEYSTITFHEFTPLDYDNQKSIILYPGGKVDPLAYASLASNLADRGIKTIIVPMRFNLAILSPNRADYVINDYPHIEEWYVMGHSLGGVMAASYAANNLNVIDGLILLASYPMDSVNLSTTDIDVLSIYASRDGLLEEETINSTKGNLPSTTNYVEITGGNHSQMGWYGLQDGDLEPTISKEEQLKIIVNEIVNFIY